MFLLQQYHYDIMFSESLSFESTTFFSDQHVIHEATKTKIRSVKHRVIVIKNIALLLSFICLIIAIFVPWFITREKVSTTVNFLISQYINSYALKLSSSCKEMLTKFETISHFLALIMQNPGNIRCTPDGIPELIKFAKINFENISPKPIRLFIGHNGCFVEYGYYYNNSSQFDLIYIFRTGENSSEVRKYDQTVDFENNWDYKNTGTLMQEISYHPELMDSLADGKNDTFWSYRVTPYPGSDQYQMTSITPIRNSTGHTEFICGIAISTVAIASVLKVNDPPLHPYYAFLSIYNGVIFESEIGNQEVQGYRNNSTPIYPKLNEINNSFWSGVHEVIKEDYDSYNQIFEYKDGDFMYLIYIEPIASKKEQTHKIVIALRYDEISSKSLGMASEILIGCICILAILFVVFMLLKKRNDRKTKRKLLKNSPLSMENEDFPMICGSIGRSISKLRQLQLTFPEDIMLNKVIDKSVAYLSEPESRSFAVFSNTNCQCEYCQNLPKKEYLKPQLTNDKPFDSWCKLHRNSKHGVPAFILDEYAKDPAKKLVKLMIFIIQSEQILLPEFDPDALIMFMCNFAMTCIKDPSMTALQITTIYKLLHGPFRQWITNKYDLFVIYFCAFVKDVNYIDITNSSPEEEEELNEDDEYIKKCMNVFADSYSTVEQNINLAQHLLNLFIPSTEECTMNIKVFNALISRVLFKVQKEKMFELYGEFHIRVGSPDFSIHSDCADRLLFTEAIIMFCSYSPYFEKEDTMIKMLEKGNSMIFNNEELEDPCFIAAYHYEFASQIVRRWLTVFSFFAPLNQINDQLKNNIEYWENQMNMVN